MQTGTKSLNPCIKIFENTAVVRRPINVKFPRYNVRNRIFKTKKELKGKNVSITDSLTKGTVIKLKKAREMYDFRDVWSHDGKILFLHVNDRKKVKVFCD